MGDILQNVITALGDHIIPDTLRVGEKSFPRYTGEFWTARQRQASSLHEISYRACFKGELPRFFIKNFSREGDVVYDPFSGRGTTILEAALLGRNIIANDINPLSKILSAPRLNPPPPDRLIARLAEIPLPEDIPKDLDLSDFFHPRTESEIYALRAYLLERENGDRLDAADHWIRMVATNRLTGHSPGFFSVYTLPPNQATSIARQKKINLSRNQRPEYRDVKKLILRKSKSLLKDLTNVQRDNLYIAAPKAVFLTDDAAQTGAIANQSVALTVTSPPFLNIVQYAMDNWLRCWFNGVDANEIETRISIPAKLDIWREKMQTVFIELFRITAPGGWVAFEVGEIRKKSIHLDEIVIPLGLQAGFQCEALIINQQEFTKTANIWGVKNNSGGTNSNRIVLFHKAN